MNTIWEQIQSTFNYSAIFQGLLLWIPQVFSALIILVGAWLFWRVARRALSILLRRGGLDETVEALIQSALKLVIFSVAIVSALGQVGVDITGLLTGLGVVGLTMGFAAKDALSNMISGFFILWDRPFTIGDLVDIGGSYGKVQSITLRTTRVVTVDGRMLAIPNTEIINTTVASYTNFPNLRLDVGFTVAVTEDISKVRHTALSTIQGDSRFLSSPAPEVVVTSLNDYNVSMEIRAWIVDERAHIPTRFELREKVFEALRTAGIEMPFETFSLTPIEVRHNSALKDK